MEDAKEEEEHNIEQEKAAHEKDVKYQNQMINYQKSELEAILNLTKK